MRGSLLLACLLLAGCGAGVGTGVGDGGLAQATAVGFADYVLIDTRTGAMSTRATIPDLATNPLYRSEVIVFRRIPAGSAWLGTFKNEKYREDADEFAQRSIGEQYLAVFELTNAQKTRMAPVNGDLDDALPWSGVSAMDVDTLIDAFRARTGRRIRLPSADEWEFACRAGSPALFAWGDQTDAATANDYARTALSGATAPAAVGQRKPNGFGIYDQHGNVWELTADLSSDATRAVICGGSWLDPVLQCRSANRAEIPENIRHPLIGVRLAIEP